MTSRPGSPPRIVHAPIPFRLGVPGVMHLDWSDEESATEPGVTLADFSGGYRDAPRVLELEAPRRAPWWRVAWALVCGLAGRMRVAANRRRLARVRRQLEG